MLDVVFDYFGPSRNVDRKTAQVKLHRSEDPLATMWTTFSHRIFACFD